MLKVTLRHKYYSGLGALTLVADAWGAVQVVVASAGNGDITPSEKLLKALQPPYTGQEAYRPYQLPPNPMEQVQQTFCGT